MVTIICRLASRRMCFGSFRKYQLDDYLMLLTAVCIGLRCCALSHDVAEVAAC
jgi:hypothetical protein